MTIPTTASSGIALGNGATYTFSYNFVPDSASNIVVIYTNAQGVETTLSPTQYTITIPSPSNGQLWADSFTVTYPLTGSPIANGTSLTASRIIPLLQTTDLSNQGNQWPDVVEEALDTIEMQLQQIASSSARSIQFPVVDPLTVNPILPPAAQRASQYCAFDGSGNVIAASASPSSVPISSAMQPFVESTSLTAATALLQYLPPGTGAITNTVQNELALGFLYVTNYGATGNGITDDTAAIQLAITAAVTLGGGIIYFPAGTYKTSSTLTISGSNISFLGVGSTPNGSVIAPSVSVDVFKTTAAVFGLSFSNIYIAPSITLTSGATFNFPAVFYVNIDNVNTVSAYDWINYGTNASDVSNFIWVRNCIVGIGSGVVTRYGWNVHFGGGIWWEDCVLNADPATGYVFYNDPTYGNTVSSLVVSNGTFSGAYGFYANGAVFWQNCQFSNLTFTGITVGPCFELNVSISPGNASNNIAFVNCLFGSSSTPANAVYIGSSFASYPIQAVSFVGCDINGNNNSGSGFALQLQDNVWYVTVNGCTISNINGSSTANIFMIAHSGAVMKNVTIDGNNLGTAGGPADIGMYLSISSGGSLLYTSIAGNTIYGASSASVYILNNGTMSYLLINGNNMTNSATMSLSRLSSTTQIMNNLGYNPVGASALSPGASPWTYTAGASPETICISASTAIATITINGNTWLSHATGANVPISVQLPPNGVAVITYTGTLTGNTMIN